MNFKGQSTVVSAVAIILTVLTGCGPKAAPVAEQCLSNVDYDSLGIVPFPDDRKATEQAWSERIPDELQLVGGMDGFGWARICSDDSASDGLFYGEYRDQNQRYRGAFRYSHPEDAPLPDNVFQNYYMSHYIPGDGMKVTAYYTGESAADSFFLKPVDLAEIEYPSAE